MMSIGVFGNVIGNVRKHRNIKIRTTKNRRNRLVLEQNYHTTELITENLLVIEMTKKISKKPVYVGSSIPQIKQSRNVSASWNKSKNLYLINRDVSKDKKEKSTNKFALKKLKFEDYKRLFRNNST